MSKTSEKIGEFVTREFGRGEPVGPDEPLLDKGLIDSLGIMRLVAYLEKTFGVRVRDRDLVPKVFRSVRTIAAFVEGKKGK